MNKQSDTKKNITITDLAKFSGYGVGTVSRAINNKKGVNPKVRQKILNIANELGYKPNTSARAIRMQRFGNIAFMANMINPAFMEIAIAIQMYLKEHDYFLTICNVEDTDINSQFIDYMRTKRFDGLVFAPNTGLTREFANNVLSQEMPYVLINRSVPGLKNKIIIDYYYSVIEAVRYLKDLNHKNILLVGGDENILPTKQAIDGYKLALKEEKDNGSHIATGPISEEWGIEVINKYAKEIADKKITAILSLNNLITIGLIKQLRKKGFKYPQDISLISFEDGPLLQMLEPPVTAIIRPLQTVGIEAAKKIIYLINNQSIDKYSEEIMIKTSFAIRKSCISV